MEKERNREFFDGLQALAASSFPKRCPNCNRIFGSAEHFLHETEVTPSHLSGLKQGEDADGSTIVEAFRNCPCGSTLLEFFSCRRDDSDNGMERRERFDALQRYLQDQGVAPDIAREELLKVVNGVGSELLKKYRLPKT